MDNDSLRSAGLKVTLPRVKVLEIFERSDSRHQSAEEVYRKLLEAHQDIGLATVYRVLTQLEAAGLLVRHHFEGAASVFELREGTHHDHVMCIECSDIAEFVDAAIEDRQRAIAENLGFELVDHSLILYGRCPKCRAKRAGQGAGRRTAGQGGSGGKLQLVPEK